MEEEKDEVLNNEPVVKAVEIEFNPDGTFEKKEIPNAEPDHAVTNEGEENNEPEEDNELEEENVEGDDQEDDREAEEGSEGENEETEGVEEDEEDEQESEDDAVDYYDLPEHVQKYLDFFEETGGSLNDFMEVNRDFDSMSEDQVIREYMYRNPEYEGFTEEEIEDEILELFGYDEDIDDEKVIRRKQREKKKFHQEALNSLKELSEKYRADLGSSAASPEAQEALEFKRQYDESMTRAQQENEARVKAFQKDTDKVFGKDFKGFEVEVGGQSYLYKPEDVKKQKQENLNINNLLMRFADKEGNITDAAGYHKAITAASNPDAFAAHFFELGKAAALEEDAKNSKNVNTQVRRSQPQRASNEKFKIVDPFGEGRSTRGGKIKLKDY